MVGPRLRVWKVLRETDGERFVLWKKAAVFKENSQAVKMKTPCMRSVSRLRIFFM